MIPIRGLVASVGYGPLLKTTLPINMLHMTECWVVTSPDDPGTIEAAGSVPDVRLHVTDAFTRHGARFNKGLAIEECFDAMGREGWVLIWDADIIMPGSIHLGRVRPEALHGATRRILPDPSRYRPDLDWSSLEKYGDGGPIGFFQLFHAGCKALKNKRPWYEVTYGHAAGGDAYFLTHWHRADRVVLPIEVLHLGRPDRNWFGLDPTGQALMTRFGIEYRYRRALRGVDLRTAEGAPEVPHRVPATEYPGTGWEMGFVPREFRRRP